MKDNTNDGRPKRRVTDETYLGDTVTADKIAAARRLARRGQSLLATPAIAAPNLRAQTLAFLRNADLAELLAFVSSGKAPYKMKTMAWNLEARRKALLKQLERSE
ncbi:hypothetical protein [Hyphomicrobium sp.]|uniref:hypothetical protein n=1 Tax=Hyphomicrobium sp. TaxID=82 RepID=UPI001D835A18|nr:hypothetical protein [Hyphomicrobium sp.]MBY0561480.1 hypothetical protein [Hyphomicrobium sp.]